MRQFRFSKIAGGRGKRTKNLAVAVQAAIRSGRLQPGESLPSTRELAVQVGLNRLTVMNCLQNLVSEGWLQARPRSGYQVSSHMPFFQTRANSKDAREDRSTGDLKWRIVRPHAEPPRRPVADSVLSFMGGAPDLTKFPRAEFQRFLRLALQRSKLNHWHYGEWTGHPMFKQQLTEYLRRIRGLTADREVIVTHGSQEAIQLVARTFLRPGDWVAVEDPGYPPAWEIFKSLGARLCPIAVDDAGMRVESLLAAHKKRRIRLVYTTPLHHYPTTVSLSVARRQELLGFAEAHNVPILEDDYDHEFHYTQFPPMPLATESRAVCYVSTFSKIMFPAARIGFLAVAPELLSHLQWQKYLLSWQTNFLLQEAIARWMQDGGFERHVRRMCRLYEQRRAALLDGLERWQAKGKAWQWFTPSGGMSLWLDIGQDSQKVAAALLGQGIRILPQDTFTLAGKPGTHLRFGFAANTEAQIERGLAALARVTD